MPRKELGTWIPKSYQWQKMIHGKRHKVSCRQLGLPKGKWTKDRSRRSANEHFERLILISNLTHHQQSPEAVDQIALINQKIKWSVTNQQSTATLDRQKQSIIDSPNINDDWIDDDVSESVKTFENLTGVKVPNDIDPEIAQHYFGDRKNWQERLKAIEPVETEFNLLAQTEKFLTLEEDRILKPKTYMDLRNWITRMITAKIDDTQILHPEMDTRTINKDTVDNVYRWVKQYKTGSKAWGYFRRLMTHLVERDCCELPSNLHSRQFRFKSKKKKIKTYPVKQVNDCLGSLKPRFKLYAMLALNCSMLPVDLGNLIWFVDDDYHSDDDESLVWFDAKKKTITRKRVKTEDQSNVPIVTYRLWDETYKLLIAHKSNHKKYVLTSKFNTKLWTPKKNLISRQWSTANIDIPLKAFRSIGATKLRTKKEYRPLVNIYLANTPDNVKDSNYADTPQRAVDGMLKWLGNQYQLK